MNRRRAKHDMQAAKPFLAGAIALLFIACGSSDPKALVKEGYAALGSGQAAENLRASCLRLSKRSLALAICLCAALAACTREAPTAPILQDSSGNTVIQKGDTTAAIAHARAVLAELDMQQQDQAAIGADLLEGIYNEDPQQIGVALTRFAKSFPKKAVPGVSR